MNGSVSRINATVRLCIGLAYIACARVALAENIYVTCHDLDCHMCGDAARSCIVAIDTATLSLRTCATSDRSIYFVFADPSGKFLAYSTSQCHLGEDDHLMLYDLTQKTSTLVCDTVHFNEQPNPWSPDGSKLAFVTQDAKKSSESVCDTGVWVYDIASGHKEKIREHGNCVAWAPFDGKLYIKVYDNEGPVISYDVKTKMFQASPYKDVRFSPDGRYYQYSEQEYFSLDLYSTHPNERIWVKESKYWCGASSAWYGQHFLIVVSGPLRPHSSLLDCETGIVRDVPEQVIAVVDNGKNVIFGGDMTKTLQKKALADLPILASADDTKSETIPREEALKNAEPAAPAKPETKPQP